MQHLQQIYDSNPQITSIDLEFQQIENLIPILPLLSRFTSLIELSLYGNRLKQLPKDLSQLKKLQNFNITNNLLSNMDSNISSLQTLPNLKNLSLTVKDKDEEIYISQQLPNLQYLNNKKIKPDIKVKQYTSGGTQAPYSFNKSPAPSKVSQQYSGGKVSYESHPQTHQEEDITLKQEDLEQLAIVYDKIKDVYQETEIEDEQSLSEQFDEHVKNVCLDLTYKLKNDIPDNSPHSQNVHCLKAKYALYEICFSKAISVLQDERLTSIFENLHDAHSILFKHLTKLAIDGKGQQKNVANSDLRDHWIQENQELKEQIQSLEEENRKYLDTIIRHSKESGKPMNETYNKTYQNVNQTQINAPITGPLVVRTLTLRQLKEVVEEIYLSKQKYDQKYVEAKLPRETMEQHMYTFLNQKYGLKNLIIEWATAIINGIRKYANEDNDIAVFGKILRNESDEEFRFVQNQVKSTMSELLKMYLRGRYSYKHNTEIKEMQMQKQNGYILEEEATDIIKYMYNQEDANQILSKLSSLYIVTSPPKQSLKLTREEVQTMMKEKEKQIDKDNNGIVNESEFIEMVNNMKLSKTHEEISKFLNKVDPYNHQQITFSQCVTLFSQEVVMHGDQSFSILQYISLEN